MSTAVELDGEQAPLPVLHVVPGGGRVDVDGAEPAVRALLCALGQDPGTEHLRETPRRVALAYEELGVGVVLEAEHLCMTLRGVEAVGSRTVTSSFQGLLRSDGRARAELLDLVGARR